MLVTGTVPGRAPHELSPPRPCGTRPSQAQSQQYRLASGSPAWHKLVLPLLRTASVRIGVTGFGMIA